MKKNATTKEEKISAKEVRELEKWYAAELIKCSKCGVAESSETPLLQCSLESDFGIAICFDCKRKVVNRHFRKAQKLSQFAINAKNPNAFVVIADQDICLHGLVKSDLAIIPGDDGGVLHYRFKYENGRENCGEICCIDLRHAEGRFLREHPEKDPQALLEWVYTTASEEIYQYRQEDLKNILRDICRQKGKESLYVPLVETYNSLVNCRLLDFWVQANVPNIGCLN